MRISSGFLLTVICLSACGGGSSYGTNVPGAAGGPRAWEPMPPKHSLTPVCFLEADAQFLHELQLSPVQLHRLVELKDRMIAGIQDDLLVDEHTAASVFAGDGVDTFVVLLDHFQAIEHRAGAAKQPTMTYAKDELDAVAVLLTRTQLTKWERRCGAASNTVPRDVEIQNVGR